MKVNGALCGDWLLRLPSGPGDLLILLLGVLKGKKKHFIKSSGNRRHDIILCMSKYKFSEYASRFKITRCSV